MNRLITKVFLVALAATALMYLALVLPGNGSLISKTLLTRRAREYVADKYGSELDVRRAEFDFKSGTYACDVQLGDSMDYQFRVFEQNGALSDSYEARVSNRHSTISRLEGEMAEQVRAVFPDGCQGMRSSTFCAFDDDSLKAISGRQQAYFRIDMPLDMANPPVPTHLEMWIVCADPSWTFLEDALRQTAEICDSLGWSISYYSMTLFSPSDDAEHPWRFVTDFSVDRVPHEKALHD